MAKFVSLLLCLAAFVSTGYSLNCYHCHSEKLDGCIKSSSPKEQPCGNPTSGFKSVCYYKVTHNDAKKMDMVNATCAQLPLNAKPETLPECQPMPGLKVPECRVCESNLCNSAPVFSNSFFALLCLPVMYFATKFLL